MNRNQKGFTFTEFTELLIITLIVIILAAIAVPNFVAMENRKKDGATKANMHTVQLAMEDWGVEHDGCYPRLTSDLKTKLPDTFVNPWRGRANSGRDPGDILLVIEPDTARIIPRGMVRVSVTPDGHYYRIHGGDHFNRRLALVLANG